VASSTNIAWWHRFSAPTRSGPGPGRIRAPKPVTRPAAPRRGAARLLGYLITGRAQDPRRADCGTALSGRRAGRAQCPPRPSRRPPVHREVTPIIDRFRSMQGRDAYLGRSVSTTATVCQSSSVRSTIALFEVVVRCRAQSGPVIVGSERLPDHDVPASSSGGSCLSWLRRPCSGGPLCWLSGAQPRRLRL
jgi:hypothetical protein